MHGSAARGCFVLYSLSFGVAYFLFPGFEGFSISLSLRLAKDSSNRWQFAC
jgi:hypothetical protein